ncbi:E3 ubiquitin-protein ligase trim38 [Rhizoclosmatium sp. JEL0117]|nr:E3 ubiquitin-protein ligase trim38 [Rhizoclosmatium sp. JEL0117]
MLELHQVDGSHTYAPPTTTGGTVLVGRLHLPYPTISGRHAELIWTGETLTLTDVGSSNGTAVNGTRLMPRIPVQLKSGDKVTFAVPPEKPRKPALNSPAQPLSFDFAVVETALPKAATELKRKEPETLPHPIEATPKKPKVTFDVDSQSQGSQSSASKKTIVSRILVDSDSDSESGDEERGGAAGPSNIDSTSVVAIPPQQDLLHEASPTPSPPMNEIIPIPQQIEPGHIEPSLLQPGSFNLQNDASTPSATTATAATNALPLLSTLNSASDSIPVLPSAQVEPSPARKPTWFKSILSSIPADVQQLQPDLTHDNPQPPIQSPPKPTTPAPPALDEKKLLFQGAQQFSSKLLDQLTCSICFECMTNPHLLPCSHAYCGLCIDDWVATGKQSCPQCRAPIGKDGVVQNTLIAGIIESVVAFFGEEELKARKEREAEWERRKKAKEDAKRVLNAATGRRGGAFRGGPMDRFVTRPGLQFGGMHQAIQPPYQQQRGRSEVIVLDDDEVVVLDDDDDDEDDDDDDDLDEEQESTYSLEYARSGRSTCRTCHRLISHGAVRFAEVPPMNDEYYHQTTLYHHATCLGPLLPQRIKSNLSSIPGFSSLTDSEKASVRRVIH